ncbi:TIGR03943 family protein [Micromonospora sp. DR5-3]|uniref:TIGR03943 family putative permease subunit n=1 Tax=unclassified Micromonospora TaxID=2617518 RepID=UPI0011D7FECB|nr:MULTISPECIES: TIGR03943 family protein [unclassified Micromonospora]MCW3818826.1 TIGR03943 family protein [Micromonospora sp. DR5-3]TYC20460.1 TIGR03943 family protein [Micromonospora sp. MP36]
MNRGAQAVVMVFFGGAILRASVTDVYLRYVKQGLQPFLIAAAILLIIAAVVALVQEFRGPRQADAHSADDDGHGHDHSGPAAGWLLLLPTLALLFVAPSALGADTAARAGSALTSSRQETAGTSGEYSPFPPLPSGDPVKLTLLDYGSRALYGEGKTLRGRQVQLTGFIAPGADGQPMLARIILSCCAADGMPVKIGLSGDVPRLAADSWVQATGRWVPQTAKDPINGSDIPYLEVDTWQKIAPPKNPYE